MYGIVPSGISGQFNFASVSACGMLGKSRRGIPTKTMLKKINFFVLNCVPIVS